MKIINKNAIKGEHSSQEVSMSHSGVIDRGFKTIPTDARCVLEQDAFIPHTAGQYPGSGDFFLTCLKKC